MCCADQVLAASQSPIQKKWFQGTADAVRQYLWLFENSMREGVEDFLILAGVHPLMHTHLCNTSCLDTKVDAEISSGVAQSIQRLQRAWLSHLSVVLRAGDHLYRMNYQDFLLKHRKTGADITVAALPSDEKKATAFGLMKIDGSGRIVDFAEKPTGDALRAMRVDTTILGLDAER